MPAKTTWEEKKAQSGLRWPTEELHMEEEDLTEEQLKQLLETPWGQDFRATTRSGFCDYCVAIVCDRNGAKDSSGRWNSVTKLGDKCKSALNNARMHRHSQEPLKS